MCKAGRNNAEDANRPGPARSRQPLVAQCFRRRSGFALKRFDTAAVKSKPAVSREVDLTRDVLITLRGLRQPGKTTTLKLLVRRPLHEGRGGTTARSVPCLRPAALQHRFDRFPLANGFPAGVQELIGEGRIRGDTFTVYLQ